MKNLKNLLKNIYLKLFKPVGWVNGSHNGYDFEAKVYKLPSLYGIDGGRISKLIIKRHGKVIAAYDRGWDVEPQGLYREVYQRIKKLID